MKNGRNKMFERGIKAPDGIHDGDISTNSKRDGVSKSDVFWVSVLLVLFVVSCSMNVAWG